MGKGVGQVDHQTSGVLLGDQWDFASQSIWLQKESKYPRSNRSTVRSDKGEQKKVVADRNDFFGH